MKLSEILDSLASSELANLNFVEDGDIVEAKIPKVVSAINLGLIKLYTRFKLKKGILLLNITESITQYELSTPNVVSSSNPNGYITTEDYTGDLIEILTITSSDGSNIPYDGSGSLVLLKPNLIKFRSTPTTTTYAIEYSALPTKTVYVNSTDVNVDLPETYLHALLMFIASRFASPVGISFDANRNSMDMNYLQQYEVECQRLESLGLDVGNDLDTDLFSERGFI